MKNSNIIQNRFMEKDSEEIQLLAITNQISPVLKELWDNEKDDIYNDL